MIDARKFYRVMLGAKSVYAADCRAGGFIGGDWGMNLDLSPHLGEDWRVFNKAMIPEFLKANPDKSRIAAGLACGMLYTICRGMSKGDVVLSPDGSGQYYVGEVTGGYEYVPGGILPHRRQVAWQSRVIARSDMSPELRNSTGSIGTVSDVTKHAAEILKLMGGEPVPDLVATDSTVEDAAVFGLEKHLESFLVENWANTKLGVDYVILAEDGEIIGQQYPTDTGAMDILARSKDGKTLLVVELKKGRASDAVVGQVQRYMGYVQSELAEPGQTVRGCIIALEDDLRIQRALQVTNNIDFYRYSVSFQLFKN